MTTTYHTAHATAAPLTSAGLNAPLGTLDQAIGWMARGVNVKQYGAVGDGTTDDTAAIQAAATALAGLNGGTIYFPRGTYKVTSTVTINPGYPVRLLGDAGESSQSPSVIKAAANITAISFGSGANPSFIEQLAIIGTAGSTSGTGVFATKDVHFWRCYIGLFYRGVTFDSGCFYSRVIDCTFIDNVISGVKLSSGSNNFISQNTRYSGGSYAIEGVGGHASIKITGGSMEQHTSYSVYMNGTSNSVTLRDVYFETTFAVSGAGVGSYIFIGDTLTVNAVVVEGCYFAPDAGIAGFVHIKATKCSSLTLIGNNFQTASGGVLSLAATVDAVTLIENYLGGGGWGTNSATSTVTIAGGVVTPSRGLHLPSAPARVATTADLTLGTSYADCTGATVTFTSPVAEYATVTAIFDFEYTVAGAADALGALNVDGSNQTPVARYNIPATVLGRACVAQVWVIALSAASHTLKLQAAKSGAAPTIVAHYPGTAFTIIRTAQ